MLLTSDAAVINIGLYNNLTLSRINADGMAVAPTQRQNTGAMALPDPPPVVARIIETKGIQ